MPKNNKKNGTPKGAVFFVCGNQFRVVIYLTTVTRCVLMPDSVTMRTI